MKPFEKVKEWGFRADGSCYQSETVVDNSQTRFIRELLDQLKVHPMSPYEVVCWIDSQPEYIRSMFNPLVLADWSKRTAYRQWRGCARARSSESVIIDRGRGQPLWFENEPLWEKHIVEAERMRPELAMVKP